MTVHYSKDFPNPGLDHVFSHLNPRSSLDPDAHFAPQKAVYASTELRLDLKLPHFLTCRRRPVAMAF